MQLVLAVHRGQFLAPEPLYSELFGLHWLEWLSKSALSPVPEYPLSWPAYSELFGLHWSEWLSKSALSPVPVYDILSMEKYKHTVYKAMFV